MVKNIEKIKALLIKLIFAFSSVVLSFQLTVLMGNSSKITKISIVMITSIVSFVVAIYFWQKTHTETINECKKHKILSLIYVVLACIVWARLYSILGVELKHKYDNALILNPYRLRFFVLSIFSIIYLGVFICIKLKEYILKFYKSLDDWDKKAYAISTVILFGLVVILYNISANWYLQYDKVYSLDSGWCFANIFPRPNYYDIRHPILSIFTFPIFAIIDTFVKLLFSGNLVNTVEAIMLQFVNVQLLILIGLNLKKLTNSKMTFILYMISFPTIVYSMFFEKYQICVFLLVMYVIAMCNNSKKTSKALLISAAGCMPTSCVIGILELITSDTVKEKLIRIGKIIISTILVFIVLGRLWVFRFGLSEITEKRDNFSNQTFTLKERTVATFNMIQSSFTALPSDIITTEKGAIKYWWNAIGTKLSIESLAIVAIIIIGIISNRKKLFVKIASIWNIFAFVLFAILNWSPQESPLFSIYFSWSLVPLFVMGIDFIINKLKLNRNVVYGILVFFILIINITTMFDIQNFLFMI